MLIAVPTGVKVFNWVATMWQGSMTFETPMLFAVGFMFAVHHRRLHRPDARDRRRSTSSCRTPTTWSRTSTTCWSPGSLFAIFAGVYFWLPKWTGHMYDETLGKWHFWLSMIFFNMTFFPMHFLGLAGMPRRIPDYALQFADFNMSRRSARSASASRSCCSCTSCSSASAGGAKAPQQAVGRRRTLEWTHLPSPAPYHTFETAAGGQVNAVAESAAHEACAASTTPIADAIAHGDRWPRSPCCVLPRHRCASTGCSR